MAFQSVPETVEVTVNCVLNAVDVQNVFYARLAGGYDQAACAALADDIDAAVVAQWLPVYPTATTYVGTEVRGLEFQNDVVAVNADGLGPGLIAQVESPANVAFVVKKLSGLTGRSARGRTYWHSIDAGKLQSNANFITQAAADAILGAVDFIRQQISVSGWQPVLVSRFANGAPRSFGVTFNWVMSATEDLRVDSRRDRLPGN